MRMSSAAPKHEIHERLVGPDKETVDRVLDLGGNLAADQPNHEHRHECHAQQRGKEHRKGLRKRQRPEEPPFLRFQRKNGDETDRNDQ